MPRTTEACHQAFQRGLKDRKAYPLRFGGYKLIEARRTPEKIRATITNLSEDLKRQRRRSSYPRPLGCCTSEDAAVWLKSVPALLTYDLGYNVVPAIKALALDGVPHAIVGKCSARATSVTATIINQSEAARITLRQGIRAEYTLTRPGASTILPLVQSIEDLIQVTLKEAQPWLYPDSHEVSAKYSTLHPATV